MEIEFADRLLHESRMRLKLEGVPVRYKLPHGRGGHWITGKLMATKSSMLMVRPLTEHAHGDLLEPISNNKVRLWTSRMNPEQLRLAKELEEQFHVFETNEEPDEVFEEVDTPSEPVETALATIEPVFAETPAPPPPKVESLADQLRALKQMRNPIIDAAKARLVTLQEERKTLLELLKQTDDESAGIREELAGLGDLVEAPLAYKPYLADSDTTKGLHRHDALAVLTLKATELLKGKRGVWFSGAEIKRIIDAPEKTIAAVFLRPIPGIEIRGQKTGTLYRMPPF